MEQFEKRLLKYSWFWTFSLKDKVILKQKYYAWSILNFIIIIIQVSREMYCCKSYKKMLFIVHCSMHSYIDGHKPKLAKSTQSKLLSAERLWFTMNNVCLFIVKILSEFYTVAILSPLFPLSSSVSLCRFFVCLLPQGCMHVAAAHGPLHMLSWLLFPTWYINKILTKARCKILLKDTLKFKIKMFKL